MSSNYKPLIMWSQNKNVCGLHSAPRSNKLGVAGASMKLMCVS